MGLFGNLNTLASGITGEVYRDFLCNGTWCKPAGLVCADIIIIGAGGGGGGGSARCCCVTFPPTPNYAIGGGGGGGGGISYLSLPSASLCSSYCVVIGQGGCAGAAAAANCQDGFAGGTGGASCFGTNIAWGGKGGAGGRNVLNCTALQTTIGGAGGTGSTGSTFTGQNGGDGCLHYQMGGNSGCANGGSGGGRGGGGGAGCSLGDYVSGNGIGGSTINFCGIQLGFGSNGNQFTGCCSLPYASGGGGGCSHVYAGANTPYQGATGTQGIVRVIEYF